jgi:hypothetical protein
MRLRARIQRDDATLVALAMKPSLDGVDFVTLAEIEARARERGDFTMSTRAERLRGFAFDRHDAGRVITTGGRAMRSASVATFAALFTSEAAL